MLYVPLHDPAKTEVFLGLLDLFQDLFLECAIPMAVLLMNRRFGDMTYFANLCTDWSGNRGRGERWAPKCPSDTELWHPIKMGTTRAGFWAEWFDNVTLSQ